MGIRGRRSASELTVVRSLERLPQAPAELTAPQAQVWCRVVATKPADWFQADSQPVLMEYCRAVVLADEIARQVNDFDRAKLVDYEGFRLWKELTQMQREQSKLVAMLAVRMRLTQQSKYEARGAATASKRAGLQRPWSVLEGSATETG